MSRGRRKLWRGGLRGEFFVGDWYKLIAGIESSLLGRWMMNGSSVKTSRVVSAKDPTGYGEVTLGLHPDTSIAIRSHGRRSVIGQFAGLISNLEILRNPTAIYSGLLRPFIAPGVDDKIVVYITKPSVTYELARDGQYGRMPAPTDSVFVVFVSYEEPMLGLTRSSFPPSTPMVDGGILDWEWTLCDGSIPYLPFDYQTRYRRTLWVRP